MDNLTVYLPLFILLMSKSISAAGRVGTSCNEEKTLQFGICRYPQDCPQVQNNKPTLCDIEDFVRPVVCCPSTETPQKPTEKPSGKRISDQMCDKYTQANSQCNFDRNPLIVGGVQAEKGEFPFMASLADSFGYFCGGALISESFVLTAAHCTSKSRIPTRVKFGHHKLRGRESTSIVKNVSEIIKHPKYNPDLKYYDIALVKLQEAITFTNFIKPICLWSRDRLIYDTTVAAGWGASSLSGRNKNVLHKVELNVFDNSVCKEIYVSSEIPDGITSNQICIGHPSLKRDTCKGDSGGPIFYYNVTNNCLHYAIGITSFGSVCGKYPAVYTSVQHYLGWIEENVWPQN